jgi:hypothetical protein
VKKSVLFSAGILLNNVNCKVVLVEERRKCSKKERESKGLTMAAELLVI